MPGANTPSSLPSTHNCAQLWDVCMYVWPNSVLCLCERCSTGEHRGDLHDQRQKWQNTAGEIIQGGLRRWHQGLSVKELIWSTKDRDPWRDMNAHATYQATCCCCWWWWYSCPVGKHGVSQKVAHQTANICQQMSPPDRALDQGFSNCCSVRSNLDVEEKQSQSHIIFIFGLLGW